ncbi:MAG TPA: NrdH-redoxin [Gammaproteobacteria bacterium]|nr:glutaredoxin family protein [Gammaproteobacteria bacterium]MBT6480801.1 glutaredoxin family protein [Gammaproteobacteria bacterium]MBT7224972.1 glutaredoxin family protein [Gammaproteobacteria bacterium]HAS49880.1 NrdH-redoxin [Gammaproteobacteria bacterium]
MNKLIFYTTAGCHLCEHADLLLQELVQAANNRNRFEIEEVDISTDEKLVELYGIRIPVVKNAANGKEIGWPFGVEELTTLF